MKKIILMTVAFLLFSFANAQNKENMSFGVKGGVNVANFTGDDVEGASSLIAFQIGIFAEFKISDKFSIQPELMYSAQGGKQSATETGQGYSYLYEDKAKLSYLTIPVMVKYYATPKFSIEFGPQIGFLLSAKSDWTTSGGGGVSESGTEDIKDEINSVDFGLNLGTGYDFTDKLSLGLRYNLGLSSVPETEFDQLFPGSSDIKNSVFSISISYKF